MFSWVCASLMRNIGDTEGSKSGTLTKIHNRGIFRVSCHQHGVINDYTHPIGIP